MRWVIIALYLMTSAAAAADVPKDCVEWAANAQRDAQQIAKDYPQLAGAFGDDYERQVLELCVEAQRGGNSGNGENTGGPGAGKTH